LRFWAEIRAQQQPVKPNRMRDAVIEGAIPLVSGAGTACGAPAREPYRGEFAMLRKSILIAASIACIGMLGTPAAAADKEKGKWSQDTAQGYCASKDGSTFFASPDGMQYGCG